MKDTEFVQISTRVRASLGALSHSDRIRKAVDAASSLPSLCAAVRSMMPQDASVPEDASLDGLCDIYLGSAVKLVRSLAPDDGMYDSLFYRYDAANLKLCIKASVRSLGMPELFPFGTVDTKTVAEAAEKRDFSRLPEGMARGCAEGLEEYAATGDAMAIDLCIDRGCFEDTERSAAASGVGILKKIASFDADSANTTAFARICAMKLPAETKRAVFSRAFVSGGEIPASLFPTGDFTFAALKSALAGSRFAPLVSGTDENDFSVSLLEDKLSKARGELLGSVRFIPFGADVPAAYILEREDEVRAFSLIGAYIQKGAAPSEIAEALA